MAQRGFHGSMPEKNTISLSPIGGFKEPTAEGGSCM